MPIHFFDGTDSALTNPNGKRAREVQCDFYDGHSNNDSNVRPYPKAEVSYQQLVQSSELFWEKLKDFHRHFGTKFSVPTVGGKALDLHRLFVEITSRGGIDKVINDRKWKEVTVLFPSTTPMANVSFVLRKHYLSLVYHFEQVYYFKRKVPLLLDSATLDPYKKAPVKDQFSAEAPKLRFECSAMGNTDTKIDNGYRVGGSKALKGALYHCPDAFHRSGNSSASEMLLHREQKSQMAVRGPCRPKPNPRGYTFFFAEQYPRLEPLYHGQEKAIGKEIGRLWSELTDAEKEAYREKGERDKRRYEMQLLMYRSSQRERPSFDLHES